MVENPIDVIKIQQKLKTDEYANMDELKVSLTGPCVGVNRFFKADFELMVANTRLFYKRGSPEYRDATELGEFLHRFLSMVQDRFLSVFVR